MKRLIASCAAITDDRGFIRLGRKTSIRLLTKGHCVFRIIVLLIAAWLAVPGAASAQTREQKVRGDKAKVEAEGFWIYNDLARGFADAKRTGHPLLVVLRCIPCEQCVKLDD